MESDEEWDAILDEIAGERAEPTIPKLDPRFTERHDGHTPSGGDFSVAYYYDENGFPCEKKKAKGVNIVEYKEGWERINETYAWLH